MSYKVSIILPIYNVAGFLERCIGYLLNQTYKNIEIILVDDGSIDTSGSICKKYAEEFSNVHYFYQENKGVSAARNKGVDLSIGDFVLFVDPDDYIDVTAVEKCIAIIDKYDCDMVSFLRDSSKNIDESKDVIVMSGLEACKEALFDHRGGIVAICSKKSIVMEAPLKGYCYSEDTDICYKRFFLAKKVGFLEERLYHVVGDNLGSLTRTMPNYVKRFATLQVYEDREIFIENHFDDKKLEAFNIKQILRSAMSLLTTLYFSYNQNDAINTEEYKRLRMAVLKYRNNKDAVKGLGLKYRILLRCFEKNNLHLYYSKISYFIKKKSGRRG